MKVWELARVKVGGKADVSHITLIAHAKGDYLLMRDKITPERMKRWFGPWVKGEVVRFELPKYWLMNFVMYGFAEGSVAVPDPTKYMSSYLLNMDI